MAGTDTNKVTINVNGTDLEFTKIGNILGPSGKDGINGKSIYANTVNPWSVSGWNPAVAGDLFLNTTTGILWSAKAGAVTSNVQSNWAKVGELAGKITVDSALSSTSTNPVQNKVIKSALDGKAGSSHSHSSLTNSSGRIFNVPTGGSGGEQKTLVITDDLNAYQPAGNYASSTHKHPISDINDLRSTIDGIYTDMGLQDEAIARKADENHAHPISDITGLQTALDGKAASSHTHTIGNVTGLQSALNGKSNLDHNHDSVYQAKGDYATNDALKSYVTGTTFIDYTTYIEGEVNKKANISHDHDVSDINGLQSALDGKSSTGHTHSEYVTGTDFSAYTSWIEGEVNGKSDKGHTHSISNVDGLQSALDGKSNIGHTHSEYVTGTDFSAYTSWIEGEVNGKSDIGHTHSQYLTSHQDISGKYNTSDLGNTTFKVTRGTSQSTKNTGYWAGMLNSWNTNSTEMGYPTLPSSGKWWHVISMDWTGTDTNNWISQLALPTQDGGVPHYRRNDGGGGVSIDSSTWHPFITDENIGSQSVNYATTSHLLRTYNAGDSSHGEDYYLKCKHNVDGDGRFKLHIIRSSNGAITDSTSVDYANSAGTANYFNYGRGAILANSSSFTNNFCKDIFGEENNNNYHLVALRTNSQAPSCLLGDYSSGIA